MTSTRAPSATSESPQRRGGLSTRLATAAVCIPLIMGAIWLGGVPYRLAVAALLGVGVWELYRAAEGRALSPEMAVGVAATATLALSADLNSDVRLAILAGSIVAVLVALIAQAAVEDGFRGWCVVLSGVLYVGLLGGYLVSLRLLENGREWVLLAIFTTFATDTGAYAVGSLIGRRKLAPRISPTKTVEGGIGGLIAAAGVCVALNKLLNLEQPPLLMLALGGGIGVAGQLGDVGESLLKRSLGVKDMGRLLPGHGGVLDRLDSILLVTPLVYYVVRWGIT